MENRRKRLCERIGVKIFAVLVATVLFGACFFSGVLTVVCIKNGVYADGGEQFLINAVSAPAHRNADVFVSRLLETAPLRVDNGALDRNAIDRNMDNFTQDDCNYIFVMNSQGGEQLYTTGNSESAHVFGYQKVVESYVYPIDTIDLGEMLDYSETFSDIYEADAEMSSLASNSGFNGRLEAVLEQVVNGVHTDMYVTLAEADGNSSIAYTDSFAYYAGIYNASVPDNEQEAGRSYDIQLEQESESAAYVVIIPQDGDFDWNNIRDKFDVIDAEDGETYQLYLDAYGRWNYRGEQVEMQYVPNFLEHLLLKDRVRLMSYLNGRTVGISFRLEGTIYMAESPRYSIDVYVDKTPSYVDSAFFAMSAVGVISRYADAYPALLAAFSILLLIFIIMICCIAGRRYGDKDKKPIWFDKIPFELFAVANFFAIFWLLYVDYRIFVYDDALTGFVNYRMLELAVMFAYPFCAGLLVVLTIMTLATRLKSQCFWRTTAVGMVVLLVVKVWRFICFIFKNLRLTWKVLLLCAGIVILDFFTFVMVASYYSFFGVFIWFVGHVLLTILLLMWAIGFTRIRDYSKKIAQGELGTRIDRDYLFGDLKRTAEDLEGVGEGVRRAVDERMRSERLKTELITNVSHDLKTPLTSIVNYVDILSKDDIQDESAKEHIDVLKRQAARMKKLIEDLVEVSKASSGNVSVNLERTDVNLLLTQTVTEYSQRFEDGKLVPVVKIPEKKMIANLDGRLMWRVLDNLCNNICKYALAGTRVYVTAEEREDTVIVSFKNISRFPLDVTGEDLMERFVRGDSSRNTEGSGLGLSIAKSLCDLQGVGFDLAIDGDLFKAELTIQKANDDELLNDEPIVYEEPLDIREARVVVSDGEEQPAEAVEESAEDVTETAPEDAEQTAEPVTGETSEEADI